MKGLDAHIEGDHCLNNPARLLDCPNCDGQYWPEDLECSFCGYKIKAKCSLCDMEFDTDDSQLKDRKIRHAEKHTRGLNYKKQSLGGGNNTIGIPSWSDEK